jgi:hypothetical protein
MKSSKLLLIAIAVTPWLTIPLLGRGSFRTFFPASLFMYIYSKIMSVIGERKKWWGFYKGIQPLNSMDFFIIGPFFVTSFWMLKWNYGKFPRFLISNTLLQIVYIFLGLKYMERYRILNVKLSKIQYLGYHFSRTLLLYAFEFIKRKLQTSTL